MLRTMGLIFFLGKAKQSFCPGPPYVQEQVFCFQASQAIPHGEKRMGKNSLKVILNLHLKQDANKASGRLVLEVAAKTPFNLPHAQNRTDGM